MKKIEKQTSLWGLFKNPYAIVLSFIFSFGTIVGYSYYTTESWVLLYDVTLGRLLLGLLACLACCLFYLILFAAGQFLVERIPCITRRTVRGRVEEYLFEKHSFLAPFVLLALCTLPYVICFFPGTVAPDARGQLYSYFAPWEMNGHHPIGSTLIMGGFVELGRVIFGSASIGLFLFTGTQTLIQLLVMSYMICYQKRLEAPILLRWATLAYFGVFPLFQMWGFTVIKDSVYYISFAMLILSMLDYFRGERRGFSALLLTVASFMMVVFRKEGRYLVFVTLMVLFVIARKYWQDFFVTAVACVSILFIIEGVYMPVNGIKDGPVKEMLSLPLQQTGRYIWMHMEEITSDERAALEEVFIPELTRVGYVKETSDCVKGFFEDYPSREALKGYFKVWYRQGLKHPATYLQATLNQTYGYFYPPRRDIRDELAYFGFSFDTAMYLDRDNVEASFVIQDVKGREEIKKMLFATSHLPLVGGLYRAGTHSFLLLGMIAVLLSGRKYKKVLLLIPAVFVLVVAIASPLNASVRYMMPIMMVLPIHIAWCADKE